MELINPLLHANSCRLISPSGLSVEMNANGSLRRMDYGDILINLSIGNEMEGGPMNLFLRRLGDHPAAMPLLGPRGSASYFHDEKSFIASGIWGDLRYSVRLLLAESSPTWFWHVEIENHGSEAVECDLIYTQDIALANYGAVQLNEYYVSQYVDHTPLEHPERGVMVASRQNQSMGGRCPWTVIGSLGRGVSYATDALQFHGLATRAGELPLGLTHGLPGKRRQHEHSMVCVQEAPFTLKPRGVHRSGFFGLYQNDKMTATHPKDSDAVDQIMALPEAKVPMMRIGMSANLKISSLFSQARVLVTEELSDHELAEFFDGTRRHEEWQADCLLSFFYGASSHVVLKAKELQVLRPHGHLLRSGGSLTVDESALTSTAWMGGVFHSMVTQGHVSINRFLSTCHTYLGIFRSHGQRVFIEVDGSWQLLGIPSAFEMNVDSCRWIYRHAGGVIEVCANAPDDCHKLGLSIVVRKGPAMRFLISHHVAINGDDGNRAVPLRSSAIERGIFVQAVADSDVGRRFPEGGFQVVLGSGVEVEKIGGDELLFTDGVSRAQPFLCFLTAPSVTVELSLEGCLVPLESNHLEDFWSSIDAGLEIRSPQKSPLAASADRMAEIFPWFIHNALVHYLSPRGLEQYSGGGWGTRDVCQGPLELLLALGRFDSVRDLLVRVFRQQNVDGDWPQWFMFFDRERGIRPGDSHGDIVYWPVLALAQYLTATGDAGILETRLPYFHPMGNAVAEQATIFQHVERALELIQRRVVPGTNLAAYGHGDWNDSLQPVKPEMRERLCSSWTVTLNYQTYVTLAGALRNLGNDTRATELESRAAVILRQFQDVLIVDGVTTGLASFPEGEGIELLVHPRDQATGLSYSVLPMVHGIINGMYTPEQATSHLKLIRNHLLGPDGVHLFDQPMTYRGGPQSYFQRAESASFFGREIGIMYTHAHLRYAEALACMGEAEDFFTALCQVNPIAIRELVPSAALRQANCYYSSSDPAFDDRYEASADYGKVGSGEVALEGGWRVYSSGAGISVRLIMQCFLGIRIEKYALVIDPVIPVALSGMEVRSELVGHQVSIVYHIAERGCGTMAIHVNKRELDLTRDANPYRLGAARISMEDFLKALSGGNFVEIYIS